MPLSSVLVALGLCLVHEASSQLANDFSSGGMTSINPATAIGANGVNGVSAANGQTSVNALNGVFGYTGTGLVTSFNGVSSNFFGQSAAGPPIFRVGACRSGSIFVDNNYNSDSLFNENNGKWIVSAVPLTTENSGLTFALAFLTPASASSQQSAYILTFYTQVAGEDLKIGLRLVLQDIPQSFVTTATTIDQNQQQITFNIFYLGHVTGVWSYFYICSDQFSDVGVDYRYLLTHGDPLTQQDAQALSQIDQNNQFRGQLTSIY